MRIELPDTVAKAISDGISKILSDNQWHAFHEFIPLAEAIDPETAARIYLARCPINDREKMLTKPLPERIRRGRRRIIEKRLSHLIDAKVLEVEGRGYDRRLRLAQSAPVEPAPAADPVPAIMGVVTLAVSGMPDYRRRDTLFRLVRKIAELR